MQIRESFRLVPPSLHPHGPKYGDIVNQCTRPLCFSDLSKSTNTTTCFVCAPTQSIPFLTTKNASKGSHPRLQCRWVQREREGGRWGERGTGGQRTGSHCKRRTYLRWRGEGCTAYTTFTPTHHKTLADSFLTVSFFLQYIPTTWLIVR